MKEQLLQELRQVECQLSPENLTRDGEARRGWVVKEVKRLAKIRAKIIEQLGYEPSFKELYNLD